MEINGGFRKKEEEKAHQIQETAVKEYDSLMAKQKDVEAEESQFAVASVSTIANEHSFIDETLSSSISNGSVALESATLVAKTPEKEVENSEEQKGMDYAFSQAVVGIHSIASPNVVDDDKRALEYEYNGLLQKPIEYSIFTETKREEIHTFYGSNHSSAKSSRLTSIKAVSPTVTSSVTESLLLDHKNSGIIDSRFSGHGSGQATGTLTCGTCCVRFDTISSFLSDKLAVPIHYNDSSKLLSVTGVEEEKLVAHGNGGLSHKRKDVIRDWKFPDDGKHVVHQTDESMPPFPAQLLTSNGRSPETSDAYYRLLRDGR